MKSGFSFELYGETFTNCFIESSSYKNGNLQLSLYGLDSRVNQISHFADITLNQNVVNLTNDTIVVDNKFKPNLVPQLEKLGILVKKVKMCVIDNVYPIYKIDFSKLNSNRYYYSTLLTA